MDECPMWSFDGSSTLQAEGGDSDCLLKPAFICEDPDRINGYLVMCEVLNADGTPHATNGRATIEEDDDDFWFGFEVKSSSSSSISVSILAQAIEA